MTRSQSLRSLLRPAAPAAALALLWLGLAPVAGAQQAEVEIDRDPAALEVEIRPRVPDVDVADTVMTFTSMSRAPSTVVRCLARDRTGAIVGRTRVVVPAHGVKYVLASDFSGGADFVGHVVCQTGGFVLPAAIFLGPEITDLPAHRSQHDGLNFHRFPLVATY